MLQLFMALMIFLKAKIAEGAILNCKHSYKKHKRKFVFVILFSFQMIKMLLLFLELNTVIYPFSDIWFWNHFPCSERRNKIIKKLAHIYTILKNRIKSLKNCWSIYKFYLHHLSFNLIQNNFLIRSIIFYCRSWISLLKDCVSQVGQKIASKSFIFTFISKQLGYECANFMK